MTQNFDPAALIARIEAAAQKAEGVINQVEAVANTLAPMLQILGPLLPAPIGIAVEDLPTIVGKVKQLKAFIDTDMPQIKALLSTSVAGTGATEAMSMAATDVGSFSSTSASEPDAQPAATSAPVAPSGMEYVTLDGKTVLRPKASVGT